MSRWHRRYYPCIRLASDVVEQSKTIAAGLPDGRWVPARAMKLYTMDQMYSVIQADWKHRESEKSNVAPPVEGAP